MNRHERVFIYGRQNRRDLQNTQAANNKTEYKKKKSADKDAQKPVESATEKPADSPENKDPLQNYRFR